MTSLKVVQIPKRNFQTENVRSICCLLLVPSLSAHIRPCGNVRGNGPRSSHGKFSFGVLMFFHLQHLSTSWFFRRNGKQPRFLKPGFH